MAPDHLVRGHHHTVRASSSWHVRTTCNCERSSAERASSSGPPLACRICVSPSGSSAILVLFSSFSFLFVAHSSDSSKMGIWIAENKYTRGQPVRGTSLLDDLHAKQPVGDHAHAADLKRDKNGVVLVPQPVCLPSTSRFVRRADSDMQSDDPRGMRRGSLFITTAEADSVDLVSSQTR